MTFKPTTWYPIAVVLSVVNVAAAGLAAGQTEPMHAALHAALGVAFGLWAVRLRPGPDQGNLAGRLDALEGEVDRLRVEVGESQERLDFAERVLAQLPESRRLERDS